MSCIDRPCRVPSALGKNFVALRGGPVYTHSSVALATVSNGDVDMTRVQPSTRQAGHERVSRLPAAQSLAGSLIASLLVLFASSVCSLAELQFDVFLGYDGTVREASWFPVACEIFNDGPGFNGVFEVTPSRSGGSQIRRFPIELPTNTRKRFVLPVFASAGRFSTWDVRLRDARGKIRSEQLGIQPRSLQWSSKLFGSVSRVFAGAPVLPKVARKRRELQPEVARIPDTLLPDNPIALEGMDALYLSSEKAWELSDAQVEALLTWLHQGGHLILGIEQPSDVNALPWLRQLVPVRPTGVANQKMSGELQQWVRGGASAVFRSNEDRSAEADPYEKLPSDPTFDRATLPVVLGDARRGEVLAATDGVPLMVMAERGRGAVTQLMFSPEREPFKSWENRPWFWARTLGLDGRFFEDDSFRSYGSWGIDGVFGAMIDSRQVRKLPVTWLLLLLVVYLAVIGPLDQYWLRRINRQMLTWLTFPVYVALFSVLIYFIGYRLRAGETEWNEMHIVDLLPRGVGAVWRGRTFASLYSPVNKRYEFSSRQPQASLRTEFSGVMVGTQDQGRSTVEQRAGGFTAEVSVPVWTSQLLVSSWVESGLIPLAAEVQAIDRGWKVKVENKQEQAVGPVRIFIGDRMAELGSLAAHETKEISVLRNRAESGPNFVANHSKNFDRAAQSRRQNFGNTQAGRIDDKPNASMAVSLLSLSAYGSPRNENRMVTPPGWDLGPELRRGDAVILAWQGDHAPVESICQFKPTYEHSDTLWRLAVPVSP